MFARYRFAAFAAVSFAGLAGPVVFAQETTKKYLNLNTATNETVELQLTTESDAANATTLYGIQVADQGAAAVGEAVSEEATDAEELPNLWLGVQLATEIPPALAHHLKDAKGALVETVYPDSPAAESGIEAYDLIVRIDVSEAEVSDIDSPVKLLEAMKAVEAKPIDVVVIRGGEKKTISVTPRERATAQPNATATAEATDLLFYNLNVPHIRVLPALTGPEAWAMHHRLVQAFAPAANLPENVESLNIQIERDGEKTVHRVEVTTVDGKIFTAANAEELHAFPAEIRAALAVSPHPAPFALRLDTAAGAPPVQKQLIIQAAPAAAPLRTYIPAPSPTPGATLAAPWVDIVTQRDPAAAGDMTYRVTGVARPGEQLNVLKKELSELRASVERIEKLLREKE